MFYIVGGKTEFTQWETDQKLMNEHMQSGDTVVFASASGKTHNMTAYDLAGQAVVDVPNDMLQAAQGIVVTLGQGAKHKGGCRTAFAVVAADMPDGYSYRDNSKAKPNATHYDTRDIRTVTYTFDGNFEGKECIEICGTGYVKVSEFIPPLSGFLKTESEYLFGNSESPEITITKENPASPQPFPIDPVQSLDNVFGLNSTFEAICVTQDIEETDEHSAATKGIYLVGIAPLVGDTEIDYCRKFIVEYSASGELKKLDAKYLPDNVCYLNPLDKYCDKIVEINAYYTDYGRKFRRYARLIEIEEPFDGRELDLTKEEFDVLYNHLAKDTLEGNSLCLVSYGQLGSFYFEGDNRIVFRYSGIEGGGTLTYYDYKWFLEWNAETNGATLALTCNERLISSTAIED